MKIRKKQKNLPGTIVALLVPPQRTLTDGVEKNSFFWQQGRCLHSAKRVGTLLRKSLFTLSASLCWGARFLIDLFSMSCFEENCLCEVGWKKKKLRRCFKWFCEVVSRPVDALKCCHLLTAYEPMSCTSFHVWFLQDTKRATSDQTDVACSLHCISKASLTANHRAVGLLTILPEKGLMRQRLFAELMTSFSLKCGGGSTLGQSLMPRPLPGPWREPLNGTIKA